MGSIMFTLVYGGNVIYTETVPVNGNGSYTTLTGYALPTTGTVVGSYQWNASYSGDTHNSSASETNSAAEQVSLAIATPGVHAEILGDFGPTGFTEGSTTTSSATLSGGYHPTGTLKFSLQQSLTQTVCTQTVTVNGNGTYAPPTGCVIATDGDVFWSVTYSGDSNNSSVSSRSFIVTVHL